MNVKRELIMVLYRNNIPMELIELIWNNYFRGGGAINLTFLTEEYKYELNEKNYNWNNENELRLTNGLGIQTVLGKEIWLNKFTYLIWATKRRCELNKLIQDQLDINGA